MTVDFDLARPEYYAGLKVFQTRTNQQDQLKRLMGSSLKCFKAEIRRSKNSRVIDLDLLKTLQALTTTSLLWKDIGCGDGTFTRKIFEALEKSGFPKPNYEGLEPDQYFVSTARTLLTSCSFAKITKAAGFDGHLHLRGQADIISAFNALYFAKDLAAFKHDLDQALKPAGLGFFIQNTLFTTKVGEAFLGEDYKDYEIAIPTEVFFPAIPSGAYDLVGNKASEQDIMANQRLTTEEKSNTIIFKKIVESMVGISTETDAGQGAVRIYQARILGSDYGGVGHYVSDNILLVYPHPDSPAGFKALVKRAVGTTRDDLTHMPFLQRTILNGSALLRLQL